MSESGSDASARTTPRLSFPLGRSPFLAAAFCLACAAALTGIWAIIALPAPVRAALSALTIWRAWTAIARHALRLGNRACMEVRFPVAGLGGGASGRGARRAGGTILSRLSGGGSFRALVEEMFFSAPLVVLRVRETRPADLLGPPPGIFQRLFRRVPRRRRETIIIPADCMDAESHRQFRIRARRAWQASAGMLLGDMDSRPAWDRMADFFFRLRNRSEKMESGKKEE